MHVHELSLSLIISISEPIQQPQALSANQPPVDGQLQPLAFSEDMSYEQLAVWLCNDPKLAGEGYQQDISKLKGM